MASGSADASLGKQLRTLFGTGTLSGLSDVELLDRFLARDSNSSELAFAVLVERHGPMVLGVCRRMLGDGHLAEDAFQATFLILARRGASIGRGSVGGWLHRVARRAALRARQQADRRRARENPEIDPDAVAVASPEPGERQELRSAIDEELDRLNDAQRQSVVLCCLQGMSHEEAAHVLRWPVGTVKSRLGRGREQLRMRLTKRGFAPAVAWPLGADLAGANLTVSVPTVLANATARSAFQFVAGSSASGAIASAVISLVHAELTTMMLGRWTLIAMTLAATGSVVAWSAGESPSDRGGERIQADFASGAKSPEEVRTKTPLPPRGLLPIGSENLRTQGYIRALAISPDGRLAAAGDLNASGPQLTLFDVKSGRPLRTIVMPGNRRACVETIAFSPSGTKLLWGEMYGEVALWDLVADRLLFRLKLHGGNVMDVRFSPDGRLFASGGLDKSIHLRRVEKPGEAMQSLAVPQLGRLAFTPDGTRLVAGSMFNTMISVWNVSDGRLLRRIGPTAGDHLTSIDVTPDGRKILSAGFRKVPFGEQTMPVGPPELKPVVDPPIFARPPSPSDPKGPPTVELTEIRLWDIETGAHVKNLSEAQGIGHGNVALSPDGGKIAVVNLNGLRMIDFVTGKPQGSVDLPGWWGRPVTFSADGRFLLLPEQNAVAIFEVSTGRRLHHDERTPVGLIGAATWSPSGDRIVTGHSDGFVRVWDAGTSKLIWYKLLAPVVHPGGRTADPSFIGFSRDGKQIIVGGRRDKPTDADDMVIVVYEALNGQVIREAPQSWFRRAASSADGRFVVHCFDNRLIGVEVATGRRRWSNTIVSDSGRRAEVVALHFDSDSPSFGAALKDGRVIRFNGLTGHEQRQFVAIERTPEQQKVVPPADPIIVAATFSADGRTMASASGEWISLWDVEAGMLRRKIRYPHAQSCLLAMAADGKTIATSAVPEAGNVGDDTIRLYDVEAGEQVLALKPASDRASTLEFSPDGQKLLTGFQKGTFMVWDVRRSKK